MSKSESLLSTVNNWVLAATGMQLPEPASK